MKFLIDVCASSRSLLTSLTDEGHDVVSAVQIDPRATDEQLLELAAREGRILVTEDKDFGELVFVLHLPHPTIVRLVEMSVENQVTAMRELIDNYAADLTSGAVIVVTRGRIRIRRPPTS